MTIFQTQSTIVQKYREQDNFSIEETEQKNEEKYCAIYFSSNGLYYPNNEAAFRDSIVTKDRYEWKNNKLARASKHIFIRDLYKQWYIEGISREINTIDKMVELLEKEVKGYKIITLGSSAGGYAAILFGSLLRAEYVLAFAAQISLYPQIEDSSEEKDPLLFRYLNTDVSSKYFDVSDLVAKSNVTIFYFAPYYSTIDKPQIDLSREQVNIKLFSFNSRNHGIPFPVNCLSMLVNSSKKNLLDLHSQYSNKIINRYVFSKKVGGTLSLFSYLCKKSVKKMLLKLR